MSEEALWLRMALPNKFMIAGTVYNPPACQTTMYLEVSLEYIRCKYDKSAIIFYANFNFHHRLWLRRKNTEKEGLDMCDPYLSYGLEQLANFDTYHSPNKSSRLDIFLKDYPDSFNINA